MPPLLHSSCSSKTAPPLPKAKPISSAGWGTGFRKRLKTRVQQLWQRGVMKIQEKTLQTPRSAKREGRTCSRPMEKTMIKKAVPLQPMKDHSITHSHCSLGRSHTRAGRESMRRLELTETAAGAGSWQELWLMERRPHWSRFSGRSCDPA